MRIYINDNENDGIVEKICAKAGVEVFTPADAGTEKLEVPAGGFFLDAVDALILEITTLDEDLQFLLAQAILADKPILCLYKKNRPPRQLLKRIKSRSTSKNLKTFSYRPPQLEEVLTRFVQRFHPSSFERRHLPTVRFTLRISPAADEYVEWYASRHKCSKSDAIRTLLQDAADNDEEFADGVYADE